MSNRVAAVLAALLIAASLASCSSPASAPGAEISAAAQQAAIKAADIQDIYDAIDWARELESPSATELSAGIRRISDLVPKLDIWYEDSNMIGQALIYLNADVLAEPDNAATKVDDLDAIVADIKESMMKGNRP